MAEQPENGNGAKAARPTRAAGGRGLALLALFVGLVALGGIAHIYYSTQSVFGPDNDRDRIAMLELANERLGNELQRLNRERQTAIDALRAEREAAFATFRTQQERHRRTAEEALAQALERAANPKPPPEPDWKLAEAEYLLRLANHRVLMERDIRTALDLLKSADDIVRDLDDFALYEVRATLAEEIQSLEQAREVNVSDIHLRLDAVKRQLSSLSLALPKYEHRMSAAPATPGHTTPAPDTSANGGGHAIATPTRTALGHPTPTPDTSANGGGHAIATPTRTAFEPEPPEYSGVDDFPPVGDTPTPPDNDPASGFLATLAHEFGRLLRFRRIDTGFKPPPAPTEAAYLELNLRLMLEQAQLAALRRDRSVYAASLDRALEWANIYLDQQNPQTREVIAALAALRNLNPDKPAPDISRSLGQLQELRQRSQ